MWINTANSHALLPKSVTLSTFYLYRESVCDSKNFSFLPIGIVNALKCLEFVLNLFVKLIHLRPKYAEKHHFVIWILLLVVNCFAEFLEVFITSVEVKFNLYKIVFFAKKQNWSDRKMRNKKVGDYRLTISCLHWSGNKSPYRRRVSYTFMMRANEILAWLR